MPYASVDDLAGALNITATAENTQNLEACLNAAAVEIDHHLDVAALGAIVELDPGLLARVNLNRAVEWYKSPDAYNGTVGYLEVGTLPPKLSGFERHAETLLPYRASWGIA